MPANLETQLRTYANQVVADSERADLEEALVQYIAENDELDTSHQRLANGSKRSGRRPFLVAIAVVGAVLVFGLLPSLLVVSGEPVDDALAPPETVPRITTPAGSIDGIPDSGSPETVPRITTPAGSIDGIPGSGSPDTLPITDWIPGDDGAGPLPLGEANQLPGNLYLDFLTEFCYESYCFRDAVMRNIDDSGPAPDPASDPAPFVVRHGFPNSGEEPLGEGYGIDVYITRRYGPVLEDGVFEVGQTYKFTSDYVIRGTADECGPTYRDQSGPVECEWFVHDFAEGLPDGRYDLWAVWRAPCIYWLDLGYTDSCSDPSEVVSMFSASVNSPFGIESYGSDGDDPFGSYGSNRSGNPTTSEPTDWLAGDDGLAPLALGTKTILPGEHYLNFLSRDCADCFLDARFYGEGLSEFGSGPWVSGRQFFVRHGFPNTGTEPLGPGYSVNIYITRRSGPDLGEGVFELGQTYKFVPDYVVRETADECGPTYDGQTGPVDCEWFVHDFADGLPEGRYDLWAEWLAPCSAWLDMSLTDSCANADEVMSFFSASVNSPFGPDESILDDIGALAEPSSG